MPAMNSKRKEKQYLGRIYQSSIWTFELSHWIRDSISLSFLTMLMMWSESAPISPHEVWLHRKWEMNFFQWGNCFSFHTASPGMTLFLSLLTCDTAPGSGITSSRITSLNCMTVSYYWIWQSFIAYGSIEKEMFLPYLLVYKTLK